MSPTRTAPGRVGERVGRAVEAPPRRTPAVEARRASAAGSEEPEAATDVGRRRDRCSGPETTYCESSEYLVISQSFPDTPVPCLRTLRTAMV